MVNVLSHKKRLGPRFSCNVEYNQGAETRNLLEAHRAVRLLYADNEIKWFKQGVRQGLRPIPSSVLEK